MKKYLYIQADTNDGDYVSSLNEVTDEKLTELMPVIEAIKAYNDDESIKHQKYNWWAIGYGNSDNLTPEELYVNSGKVSENAFDLFNDYRPSWEDGIHSIVEIRVLEIQNDFKYL